MPKVELHMHLGGSYPLRYLEQVASRPDYEDLTNYLKLINKEGLSYPAIFEVFKVVKKIVNTEEKVFNGVYWLCKNLQSDNVIYSELRTGLKNLGNGEEYYLESILEGIKKANEDSIFTTNLLLSLKRNYSIHKIRKTIELAIKYRNKGVVGLEISGDDSEGDLKNILDELDNIREYDLPLSLHIGETRGIDYLDMINRISSKRVGHAVYVDNKVKKLLLKEKIPIEICLSSNLKTKIVSDLEYHPVKEYVREGYNISICSDDPLIFQTNQSREYDLFKRLNNFSSEELYQQMINSIDNSFAEEKKKKELQKYVGGLRKCQYTNIHMERKE